MYKIVFQYIIHINSTLVANSFKKKFFFLIYPAHFGYKGRFRSQQILKSFQCRYLCISRETGPRWPKPDAMLLISTCFQEQYGVCFAHWFSVCGHLDSSMMSERSIPSDIGYTTHYRKYWHNKGFAVLDEDL